MKYRFHPEALQEFQAAAIYYDKQQRGLGLRFPYAVLYTVEHDYVLIVAVMHCHCEPDYWLHRL